MRPMNPNTRYFERGHTKRAATTGLVDNFGSWTRWELGTAYTERACPHTKIVGLYQHGMGHFLLAMVSNFLKCVRSQADGAETNLPKRVQEKTSESF